MLLVSFCTTPTPLVVQCIEGLDALVNLQKLWLGKNKISKLEVGCMSRCAQRVTPVQNLGSLKQLRLLSIQSNRITKVEGLEELENLEELYLSHNGIQRLEGLDRNAGLLPLTLGASLITCFQTQLRTLDVGANCVSAIENISHLTLLEELWVGIT